MPVGESILLNAAGSALATGTTAIALKAGQKLAKLDEVGRAIHATAKAYHGTKPALRAWCESPDFENLPKQCVERDEETLVSSFEMMLRHSGAPSFAVHDARSVLLTFFSEWRTAALRGRYGVELHDDLEVARYERLTAHVNERLDRIENLVGQSVETNGLSTRKLGTPLGAPDEGSNSANSAHRKLINAARDLLESGQVTAALKILRSIDQTGSFSDLPDDLRFRALTNLGVAELRLGNVDAGSAAITMAVSLREDDPVALANFSVAALREGDDEAALERAASAFASNGNDQRVRLNLIQVLLATDKLDEATALLLPVDEWTGDSKLLSQVAQVYLDLERWQEAEGIARRAVDADQHNPIALSLLAAASIGRPSIGMGEVAPEALRLADELLSRALDAAKTWDDDEFVCSIFVNRASVRAMLARVPDALDDVRRALDRQPSDERALLSKGLLHLQAGDAEGAVSVLEHMPREADRSMPRVALAVGYLQLERFEDALNALLPLPSRIDASNGVVHATLALLAAERLGDPEVSGDIAEELAGRVAENPLAAIPLAEAAVRKGNTDEATRILLDAERVDDGQNRVALSQSLAQVLLHGGRFVEAASVFQTFVDEETDAHTTEQFAIALLNSGDWRGAIRWARQLRGDGPPKRVASEVEAMALNAIGDVAGAGELYFELSKLHPDVGRFALQRIVADIRLGNLEAARAQLDDVTVDSLGQNSGDLLLVAAMRHHLKMPEVMPFAFNALKSAFGQDDVHAAFIQFFLRHDEEVKDPAEVVSDCAVVLETAGGEVIYHLTSDVAEQPNEGYILSSTRTASALLGRRVGDEVTVYRTEFGKEQTGKISRILSRYAAVFQQILREYPVRFPDSQNVRVGDGDPAQVVETVRRGDRNRRLILRLYEAQVVGLGGLAGLLKLSEVDTLRILLSSPTRRVLGISGARNSQEAEHSLIDEAGRLVFDISAILTICILGLRDEVATCLGSRSISVVVHSRDILDRYLATASSPSEEEFGLLVDDFEQVRGVAASPEDVRRRLGILDEARALSYDAELVVAERLADMEPAERESLSRRVGEGSLASIAACVTSDALLVTDDLVTQSIAREKWRVPSVSAAGLLSWMRRERVMKDELYLTALASLAELNYSFLRFNGDDLYGVFEMDGFSPSRRLTRLLENLAGPICDDTAAAQVLARFVRRAMLGLTVVQVQSMAVDLSLNAITAGRDPLTAVDQFRRALQADFHLVRPYLIHVIEWIDLWMATR